MLTFDKLKIVSDINNISNIDESVFHTNTLDGQIIEQKYSIRSPYQLYIEADYVERELVVEFSGKILKDDYPKLINTDTIATCLSNINALGICKLNTDRILEDAEVVKADVCKDIDCPDYKTLTATLQASISNYKKYQARNISSNLVIEKNVQTKGLKRRLTIYDKYRELQRASNRHFLGIVEDSQGVLKAFENKVRFEINLNSKEQLRQCLHITSTNLASVLTSTANPIWALLDAAITDTDIGSNCTSITELKNQLLLEHCSNDLTKVEAMLRRYCSPNTHISQAMRPYRQLLIKLSSSPSGNIKDKLRKLLMEIVVLFGIVSF